MGLGLLSCDVVPTPRRAGSFGNMEQLIVHPSAKERKELKSASSHVHLLLPWQDQEEERRHWHLALWFLPENNGWQGPNLHFCSHSQVCHQKTEGPERPEALLLEACLAFSKWINLHNNNTATNMGVSYWVCFCLCSKIEVGSFFHVGSLHSGPACFLSINPGPRQSISLLYSFMLGQRKSDHIWTCDPNCVCQILPTRNLKLELHLLRVICSPQWRKVKTKN